MELLLRMYFDDHPPHHFHAKYGNDEAIININTLACIMHRFYLK